MSALPPKADKSVMSALCQSRPNATQQKRPLFDHLISAGEERSRYSDTEDHAPPDSSRARLVWQRVPIVSLAGSSCCAFPRYGGCGSPAPAWVACSGSAARPLSLLGSGKSNRRGAKGVGPSHRENGNGQQGKGFSAKTITYPAAGEAAKEGEREQDAGSKPGRGRDADRRRMGSERDPVRERKECEECRAHGPRRRAGKQQIDKHRRARLPHQRARKARNGSGGEIKAGTHRERAPMLALSG